LNRSLLFIALSLFTWGIGEGMFFNFQPIYLAQLGSNPQQIGLILGAFGAAMAITHIPAGYLADRFGRRPILLTAWAVGLAATVVMALARDLPLFVVGMVGYGLTAFVSSPLSSYVTAARGQWSVGQTLTLTTATYSFGMMLGPVAGGWIGDHYGLRTVYFVAAGIFVASNVAIQFIEDQPLDCHDPTDPPVGLFSNLRFLSFLGVAGLSVFAMYFAQPLTPNFLKDVRELSLSEVGLVFTAGALGTQALVGVFALIMWRSTDLRLFALGYFLMGGFRAARPLALAQARELVHTSQMGLTYGMMETVSAIIFFFTPILVGNLYARDPYLVYPIAIGLISFSILVSILFSPRKVSHA
jgi:MFS family permease